MNDGVPRRVGMQITPHHKNLAATRRDWLKGNRIYSCCQAMKVAISFHTPDRQVRMKRSFIAGESQTFHAFLNRALKVHDEIIRARSDPENRRTMHRWECTKSLIYKIKRRMVTQNICESGRERFHHVHVHRSEKFEGDVEL